MRYFVLLAALAASVGNALAVTLTADDDLTGALVGKRETNHRFGVVSAGLISFSIGSVEHQGFCLSPDTALGHTWDASIDYSNDYIGTIIDTAMNSVDEAKAYYDKKAGRNIFNKFDVGAWYAAAQVAIWETLSYYDPKDYDASRNYLDSKGQYDWNGYTVNSKEQTYLLDYFGYVKSCGKDIRISDENLKNTEWYRIYVPTDLTKSQILAELGEPGTNGESSVPGPLAALPFALGFAASLRRRRK